jgi:hypothetical protein
VQNSFAKFQRKKIRAEFVRGNFGKKNHANFIRGISAKKIHANFIAEFRQKKIVQNSFAKFQRKNFVQILFVKIRQKKSCKFRRGISAEKAKIGLVYKFFKMCYFLARGKYG